MQAYIYIYMCIYIYMYNITFILAVDTEFCTWLKQGLGGVTCHRPEERCSASRRVSGVVDDDRKLLGGACRIGRTEMEHGAAEEDPPSTKQLPEEEV